MTTALTAKEIYDRLVQWFEGDEGHGYFQPNITMVDDETGETHASTFACIDATIDLMKLAEFIASLK